MRPADWPPVVLDLDGAVGALPDERRIDLAQDWHEALRFGCGLARIRAFGGLLSMPGCRPSTATARSSWAVAISTT